MNEKSPRQFRLLITISVLFTILIVTFGLFFRQLIYWQTSEMLLEEYQDFPDSKIWMLERKQSFLSMTIQLSVN